MRRSILCICTLSLVSSLAFSAATMKTKPSPHNNTQNAAHASHAAPHTGEEVFKANCGRCHLPPMSISPGITGTVIMHMRVRARLSREDEQLLLKYMAP